MHVYIYVYIDIHIHIYIYLLTGTSLQAANMGDFLNLFGIQPKKKIQNMMSW
jgi:hypothetical protein